jgi:hypothetical protein
MTILILGIVTSSMLLSINIGRQISHNRPLQSSIIDHLQFVNSFVRVSKTIRLLITFGADVLGHLIYLEKMEGFTS